MTDSLYTGDDSTGRPSIKTGGCSCSVDGVDIDIHGDIAFFVDLFKHEIEKRVRACHVDPRQARRRRQVLEKVNLRTSGKTVRVQTGWNFYVIVAFRSTVCFVFVGERERVLL